jgi:hypothetical protein
VLIFHCRTLLSCSIQTGTPVTTCKPKTGPIASAKPRIPKVCAYLEKCSEPTTSVYRFVSAGTIEETMYQRQIYKQQMHNIAINASHEKRWFKGVQGVRVSEPPLRLLSELSSQLQVSGEEGDLFGMANILRMSDVKVVTKGISLFLIHSCFLCSPFAEIMDRTADFYRMETNQVDAGDEAHPEMQAVLEGAAAPDLEEYADLVRCAVLIATHSETNPLALVEGVLKSAGVKYI